jgi:hypothetical protein
MFVCGVTAMTLASPAASRPCPASSTSSSQVSWPTRTQATRVLTASECARPWFTVSVQRRFRVLGEASPLHNSWATFWNLVCSSFPVCHVIRTYLLCHRYRSTKLRYGTLSVCYWICNNSPCFDGWLIAHNESAFDVLRYDDQMLQLFTSSLFIAGETILTALSTPAKLLMWPVFVRSTKDSYSLDFL